MKLNQVILWGIGSILSLTVVSSFISKSTTNTLIESVTWVTHTYQVKEGLKGLEKTLVDAETGQRGFIFTGQEDFLEPYQNARLRIEQQFADLKILMQDNPSQINRLTEIQALSAQKMDELAETIALKRARQETQLKELVLSGKGKKFMDEIRKKVLEMTDIESSLLKERQKASSQAEQLINSTSLGVPIGAIIFGLGLLFFIGRKVVHPINQIASTMASSSTEIASTVEKQERIAIQQAAAVNEITTTMNELSTSSQSTAEKAESASAASLQVLSLAESSAAGARQVLNLAESSTAGAREVLTLAEGGTETVRRTLAEMSALKETVGAIASQMERLSEQAKQIGNITNIVSDLAIQTNMLALNAAVEAVRAGENGKGFAIVAGEIRKLAEGSKQSAQKINALVDGIQLAVNSTVIVTEEVRKTTSSATALSQETAEAFARVGKAIEEVVLSSSAGVARAIEDVVLSNHQTSFVALEGVVANFQQISLTAKQQAIAIQQALEAMDNLNRGAVLTASGITETRVGIEQLNQAAYNLKTIV